MHKNEVGFREQNRSMTLRKFTETTGKSNASMGLRRLITVSNMDSPVITNDVIESPFKPPFISKQRQNTLAKAKDFDIISSETESPSVIPQKARSMSG